MIKGFKEFITRGNVVDLAVAFVIGVAFKELIDAFVATMIDPLVALILGNKADGIRGLVITIGNQPFSYGLFLTAIINFVLTAAVVYFAVVVPYNAWRNRGAQPEDEKPNDEKMVELLEEIARQNRA